MTTMGDNRLGVFDQIFVCVPGIIHTGHDIDIGNCLDEERIAWKRKNDGMILQRFCRIIHRYFAWLRRYLQPFFVLNISPKWKRWSTKEKFKIDRQTWLVESFNRLEFSTRFPATTNRIILLRIDWIFFDWICSGLVKELTRFSNWLNIIDVSDRRKPDTNKIYLYKTKKWSMNSISKSCTCLLQSKIISSEWKVLWSNNLWQ